MSDRFENKENSGKDSVLKRMFTVGTVECAIFFGVVALVIAILILLLKWKALLIVAMVGLGLFIGGVANKKALFKKMVNKIVPKEQMKLYHKEDFSAGYLAAEQTSVREAEKEEAEPETEETEAAE